LETERGEKTLEAERIINHEILGRSKAVWASPIWPTTVGFLRRRIPFLKSKHPKKTYP
jgi:hypothetical protein